MPAATPPPLLGIFGRDRHDFVHGTAAPEGAEGWDLRHARHAAGFDAGRFAALFLARVVPAVAQKHACYLLFRGSTTVGTGSVGTGRGR